MTLMTTFAPLSPVLENLAQAMHASLGRFLATITDDHDMTLVGRLDEAAFAMSMLDSKITVIRQEGEFGEWLCVGPAEYQADTDQTVADRCDDDGEPMPSSYVYRIETCAS